MMCKRFKYRIVIGFLVVITIISVVGFLYQTDYVQRQLVILGLKDFSHSNNNAVSSWNSCLNNLNIDADIVFLGDSITRRYNFQLAFPDKSVVNLGLNGDTILDISERVYMLETVKPEKIFLMAGINSLKNRRMINKYYSQYVNLCEKIRKMVPDSDLYIISVLPISSSHDNRFLGEIRGCNNLFIRDFNFKLRQYAEQNDLTYIDIYSKYELNGSLNPDYSEDGIHITNDAYRFWVDAIADCVYE